MKSKIIIVIASSLHTQTSALSLEFGLGKTEQSPLIAGNSGEKVLTTQ